MLYKTISEVSSFADGSNPNFFVNEGCYRYLQAWLNWDELPPQSIASKFYKIVKGTMS
jgi:hypothetical protein